jgi:hypothetical protein
MQVGHHGARFLWRSHGIYHSIKHKDQSGNEAEVVVIKGYREKFESGVGHSPSGYRCSVAEFATGNRHSNSTDKSLEAYNVAPGVAATPHTPYLPRSHPNFCLLL